MINIVLVDDHPAILLGLRSLFSLQTDMKVVAALPRASDITSLPADPAPELFIVDLRMPDVSGVMTVRMVHRRFPRARILMLTSFNLNEEIFRALEAGAHGCMLKNIDPDEMLGAIRRVHGGGTYIGGDISKRLLRSALTSRETAILRRVAAGNTNKQIGVCLDISEFTVRNHINRIMSKLNAGDRTEAVTIAIRSGCINIEE